MMYSKLYTIRAGNCWIVTRDWVTPYCVVKRRFLTDGVTVPYIFRWFIHRHGDLFKAAILHDYLYTKLTLSRKQADKAFYETAIYYKASKFKALIAYFIVRKFGKKYYK